MSQDPHKEGSMSPMDNRYFFTANSQLASVMSSKQRNLESKKGSSVQLPDQSEFIKNEVLKVINEMKFQKNLNSIDIGFQDTAKKLKPQNENLRTP